VPPTSGAAKTNSGNGHPPAKSSLSSSGRNDPSLFEIESSPGSDDLTPAVLREPRIKHGIESSVVREIVSDHEKLSGGKRKRDGADVGALGRPPKEDRAVSCYETPYLSHLPWPLFEPEP
jgi:hypothetical protein